MRLENKVENSHFFLFEKTMIRKEEKAKKRTWKPLSPS